MRKSLFNVLQEIERLDYFPGVLREVVHWKTDLGTKKVYVIEAVCLKNCSYDKPIEILTESSKSTMMRLKNKAVKISGLSPQDTLRAALYAVAAGVPLAAYGFYSAATPDSAPTQTPPLPNEEAIKLRNLIISQGKESSEAISSLRSDINQISQKLAQAEEAAKNQAKTTSTASAPMATSEAPLSSKLGDWIWDNLLGKDIEKEYEQLKQPITTKTLPNIRGVGGHPAATLEASAGTNVTTPTSSSPSFIGSLYDKALERASDWLSDIVVGKDVRKDIFGSMEQSPVKKPTPHPEVSPTVTASTPTQSWSDKMIDKASNWLLGQTGLKGALEAEEELAKRPINKQLLHKMQSMTLTNPDANQHPIEPEPKDSGLETP